MQSGYTKNLRAFMRKNSIVASLVFFAVFGTGIHLFAAPPVEPYQPSETLDPTCTPGSANCTVQILPSQTGNTNKLMYTTGTQTAWAGNLFWDNTNSRLGIGTNTPVEALDVVGNISLSGDVLPTVDNTQNIGSALNRFGAIYASNIVATSFSGTFTPAGFTQGSIVFSGTGGTFDQDNANFFWDNTNNRLGLGTATPSVNLDIVSAASSDSAVVINTTSADFDSYLSLQEAGVEKWKFRNQGDSTDRLRIGSATNPLAISVSQMGQVSLGSVTASAWLYLPASNGSGQTAPLKFTAGTNIISPETGAVEYNGTQLFFTPASTRNILAQVSGSTALTTGSIPFATTNGYLINDSDLSFSADTLSATKLLSSTSVSTPSLISTGAITATPASGSNFNISLATTGDFAVNTNQLYVDTSAGNVGIGTTAPTLAKLQIQSSQGGYGILNYNGLDYIALGSYGESAGTTSLETSGALKIKTGGAVTRMTIESTGNVGIGTTSPLAKLNIKSSGINTSVQTWTSSTSTELGRIFEGGSGQTIFSLGSAITLRTDSSGSFINAGNFGIGTTNPITALHVVGSEIRLTSPSNSGYYNSFVTNYSDTNSLQIKTLGGVVFQAGAGSDTTIYSRGVSSNIILSPNGGNVGIGTTSPVSKLHVNGDIAMPNGAKIRFDDGVGPYVEESGNGFRFYAGSAGSREAIRIDGNGLTQIGSAWFDHSLTGNVGIGTTSPTYKFVSQTNTDGSSAGISGAFRNSSIYGDEFLISNLSGESRLTATWETSGIDSNMTFRTTTAAGVQTEKMRITAAGNVGIGTTTPGSLLEVSEDTDDITAFEVKRTGTADRYFRVTSRGSISAASVDTSSAAYTFSTGSTNGSTSGTRQFMTINQNYTPASGTATFNTINLNPTINSTGTYAGTIRGIYYNPTLTSTTGATHVAFENTTGNVLLGTTSGNVGIGTTTPTSKLHIVDSTSGSGAYTNSYFDFTRALTVNNDTLQLGIHSVFTPSGSNQITKAAAVRGEISNSSNTLSTNGYYMLSGVDGLVTASGTGKIYKAAGVSATLANSSSASVDNIYGFEVKNLTNTGTISNTYGVYVGDITTGTQTNTPFSIYASDANALNYFAGNVGIGTTSPDATLSVRATSNPMVNVGADNSNKLIYGLVNTPSTYGRIQTIVAGSYTSNLALQPDGGKVGVGTNAPRKLLSVGDYLDVYTGSANSPTTSSIRASSSNNLLLNAYSTGSLYLNYDTGTGGVLFGNGASGTTGIWNSSGNVGIGTTAPSFTFHLVGSYGQDSVSGTFARYNLTQANADQRRSVWDFYTNTAVAPDFFGSMGFKFEGGVSDAFKQFQINVANSVTPKMVVDGSGRVAIGTITPTARLDVYNTVGTDASGLRISTTNGSYTAFYQDGSEDSRIDSVGASNGGFYVNYTTPKIYSINNNNLYVKATGEVGIGTTSPATRLSVLGNGASTPNPATWITAGTPIVSYFSEGTTGNADMLMAHSSDTNTSRPVVIGRKSRGTLALPTALVSGDTIFSFLASGYSGTSFLNTASINTIVDSTVTSADVPQAITFETGVSSRTERMRITSSGNVGIGTISPDGPLHVMSGTTSKLTLTTSDYVFATTGSRTRFGFGASTGNTYSTIQATSGGGGGVNNLVLQPDGGNIGIGTTSPNSTSRLEVYDGTAGNGLRVTRSSVTSQYIDLVPNNSTESTLISMGGNSKPAVISNRASLPIHFSTGGDGIANARMTIDGSGNVGIGTTSPAGKLDVSGVSIAAPSAVVTAGDLVVDTANKTVYIGRQSDVSGDNTNFVFRDRVGSVKSLWENSGSGSIGFSNFTDGHGMRIGPAISGSIGSIGTVLLVQNAQPSTANPTAIFKGSLGQTGDLMQWQDNAGTVLSSVNSSGNLLINGSAAPGITVRANTGATRAVTLGIGNSGTRAEFAMGAGLTSGFTVVSSGGWNNFAVSNENGDVARVAIGSNGVVLSSTRFYVNIGTASHVGQVIRGATSQTADLQQWQDVGGTVLAEIDASGSMINDSLFRLTHNASSRTAVEITKSNDDGVLNIYRDGSIDTKIQGNGNSYFSSLSGAFVGIGTSSPSYPLDVSAPTSGTFAQRITRNTAATTNFNSTNILVSKSTGDAADGFGGGSVYAISDNTVGDTLLGSVGAVRNGADNSGALVFNTYLTGSFNERMRITSAGQVSIGVAAGIAQLGIVNQNAGGVAMVVRGAASQSANLVQFQDAIGTVLSRVGADGSMFVKEDYTSGAAVLMTFAGNRATYGIDSNADFYINTSSSRGTAFKSGAVTTMYVSPNVTGNNLTVGGNTVLGKFGVINSTASTVASVIRGAASQTANLTEWQDSTGTAQALITSSGQGVFNSGGSGVSLGNVTGFNKIVTYSTGNTFRLFSSAGSYASFGSGSVSVGATYASTAAPTNSLIVEGSIGVGTTSPSNSLHVKNLSDNPVLVEGANGNTYLSGYSLEFARNSANYIWAKTSGGDLRFTVNGNAIGSASMVISNAGNVGIGTSTPSAKLDVSTTAIIGSAVGMGSLTVGNTLGNYGSVFQMLGYSTTFKNWQIDNGITNGGTFNISPSTTNGGTTFTTPALSINTNSNVGIGTTSPGAMLQINISSASTIGQIIRGASSQTARLTEWQNSAGTQIASVNEMGDIVTTSTFYTNLGVANTSTGNNAYYGLPSTGPYITRNIADTNPALYVRQVHASSTGDILQLRNSANTSLFNVSYSGNVGIGTTSPGAQIQINTSSASTIGQIIRGAASQTANLTEWQDSAGTVVSKISVGGRFATNNTYGGLNDSINTSNYYLAGNRLIYTISNQPIIDSSSRTLRMLSDRASIYIYGSAGVGATGPYIDFDINSSATAGVTFARISSGTLSTATSGTNIAVSMAPSFVPSGAGSGNYRVLDLSYTANGTAGAQTGTATGIYMNVTETTLNGMTSRLIDLKQNGTQRFYITNGGYTFSNHFTSGGEYQYSSGSRLQAPSSGVLVLTNHDATTWNRLSFGGTTSSFPALARSNAALQVIAADGLSNADFYVTGKVGIGTTNPSSKLTVQGDKIRLTTIDFNNVDTGSMLQLDTGTATGNTYSRISAFSSGLNSWNNLILQSGPGNVGIGTIAPGYKLEVGNTGVIGVVARFVNSSGSCDINPTTTSLSCSSDQTLKKNITSLSDEFLTKVISLRPVTYNWNAEVDGTTGHIGFIAQEVEQIFPDLVATDSVTGLKSVNYIGFIPYITKAVIEQNVKIGLIEDRVTNLENIINGTPGLIGGAISSVTNLVVDTLKVGTPEKRTGITIYDEATGDPFCIKVVNGNMQTVPGECGVVSAPVVSETPTTSPEEVVSQEPESTLPPQEETPVVEDPQNTNPSEEVTP